MGFQINGTEVLGTSGIVNNANSFKTIGGNSILGSGNITDDGASALLFNTIGSYTCASVTNASIYQTSVAASSLRTYYRNRYGGYSYVTELSGSTTYYTTGYHGLSGTWMHKSPYVSATSTQYRASLWQRIA